METAASLASSALEAAAACGCTAPRIHVVRRFAAPSRELAQDVRRRIRDLHRDAEVVDEPEDLPAAAELHVCARVDATRRH